MSVAAYKLTLKTFLGCCTIGFLQNTDSLEYALVSVFYSAWHNNCLPFVSFSAHVQVAAATCGKLWKRAHL